MLVNERPDDKRVVRFDSETALREARSRRPLKRLMQEYGCEPKNGKWKDFECPFCHHKSGAGVIEKGGQEFFKCFHSSCPTGGEDGKALDEVGFIALKCGLNRQEAFVAYLKEAGVWMEREKWKENGEGKENAEMLKSEMLKSDPPSLGASEDRGDEVGDTGFTEEELAAAVEEGRAFMENREIEKAEIGESDPPSLGATEDRGEGGVEPQRLEGRREGETPVEKVALEELFAGGKKGENGEIGKAESRNGDGQEGSRLPIGDTADCQSALPGEQEEAEKALPEQPTNVVALPGVEVGDGVATPGKKRSRAEAERDEEELGLVVLRAFYDRLSLSEADQEVLWRKRGLDSRTQRALGYRSNNRDNGKILSDLLEEYPEGALVRSGLFFRDKKSKELRFSGIYTGMGRTGEESWEDEEGQKHERVVREYVQPILIPYWNERGQLVHLRPHKDHPAGHPPMVYVAREIGKSEMGKLENGNGSSVAEAKEDSGEAPARYFRVVITEGEFKAGALWQVVGDGRSDDDWAWGVAALPGINMARNEDVRWELDDWLKLVGAREVVVAYDRQDKATEFLPDGRVNPSFHPDKTKRYDAEIWSRYLAIDLMKKLHVNAKVCVLPEEWMDGSLKADWDGGLAKMVHGEGKKKQKLGNRKLEMGKGA